MLHDHIRYATIWWTWVGPLIYEDDAIFVWFKCDWLSVYLLSRWYLIGVEACGYIIHTRINDEMTHGDGLTFAPNCRHGMSMTLHETIGWRGRRKVSLNSLGGDDTHTVMSIHGIDDRTSMLTGEVGNKTSCHISSHRVWRQCVKEMLNMRAILMHWSIEAHYGTPHDRFAVAW